MTERMTMPQATIEFLKMLRAAGVKEATLTPSLEVTSVVFCDAAPSLFDPDCFHADTMVPPAEPFEDVPPNVQPPGARMPPALKALLDKPSVS